MRIIMQRVEAIMAEAPDILPSDQCATLPSGGYDCEFVDSLPESLTCPVCLLGFRDPHLLSCCGANICESCIGRVKAAGQPCPHCKQSFDSMLDRKKQRKVLNLNVRCSSKMNDCEWEGELRHLENHEREDCGWALVQCRHRCGGRFPRRELAEHENDDCPQRPVDVKMVTFMRKMEVKLTSEKERHETEMAAVREEFKKCYHAEKEHHVRELAIMQDEVKNVREEFQKTFQEEREKHKRELDTERKTYSAQVQQLEQMMSRELDEQKKNNAKMEQLEQSLKKMRVRIEQQKKEYEAKIEQLEQSLQRKLRADTEQKVVKLRKEVEEEIIPQCAVVKEMRGILSPHLVHSCEFTMIKYRQHKKDGDSWYSPPFYTRPGGYKMCVQVYANGNGFGTRTHVSVYVFLMRGEHDDKLKWPFQGDITVQLLNQKRDQEHVEHTADFGSAYGSAARVTSGEYAQYGRGSGQFITHTAVESTSGTTQYLYNDCLKWRVTKTVVHSV